MEVTRRQVLTGMGGVALSVVAGTGIMNALSCSPGSAAGTATPESPTATPQPTAAADIKVPELPWPYKKLDPVAVAERAYKAYSDGGCMYGAYEGIIGELRQEIGFPYTVLPVKAMAYGKAGVVGWGTLCGALNGASAVIYTVSDPKIEDKVIDEVFGWYAQEGLPNYKPKSPKFDIVTSVAGSPLCHQSVTNWCNKSGLKALSPERAERCAQLTASVAKYVVELLNQTAGQTFTSVHAIPAAVTQCLSCHGKGGVKENVHATKMNSCTQCHDDLGANHPGR